MPGTPDFDAIALKLVDFLDPTDVGEGRPAIAEALRHVWNARGAADIAKIAAYLSRRDEGTLLDEAIVSVDAFERALRTLDR